MLSFYVSFLRALYQIHQNNHWKCKGTNFYANHLLFQRLYEEVVEDIDIAAEKSIGVFDELDVNPGLITSIVEKFMPEKFDGDLIQSSLAAEEEFLKASRKLYLDLKSEDNMSLGIDDMIMSVYNKHEGFVYLLKQAVD